MIYAYIAICVSMISYNIIYVFILRYRQRALVTNSQKLETIVSEQIDILKNGGEISQKHKKYLFRELDKTSGITAFDKALENISKKDADPDVWMQKHFNNDASKIDDYKTKNYIDASCTMQWSDFKTFKEKRIAALREALIKAFK